MNFAKGSVRNKEVRDIASMQPTVRQHAADKILMTKRQKHDIENQRPTRSSNQTSSSKQGREGIHSLEGKPKSKSMPKLSGPQGTMPNRDHVVPAVCNDFLGEEDFNASKLAHATNDTGLQSSFGEGRVIPGSHRPKHGRIHNRFVDVADVP